MWWSEKHRRATFLPPIVGLVLSHDPHGWRSPTHLWDLRENPQRPWFQDVFALHLVELPRRRGAKCDGREEFHGDL
jgi:hypothetical protein